MKYSKEHSWWNRSLLYSIDRKGSGKSWMQMENNWSRIDMGGKITCCSFYVLSQMLQLRNPEGISEE